ncbi:MAG: GerAB/ArcD/ProY family transporter, partial [Firmicutes bacterium]|nr:GerAB/ArcD/ProY family transporter [Bacillota bacterium]
RVAAAVFFLYLLVETALVMREFTETVVSTVLPATPAEIVALLFAIVILYFARQDLEGLVRVAIFFGSLLLVGLVLLCLLPLNWFDGRLLLPLWGKGVGPTLGTGVLATSMFATVPLLAIVGSRLKRVESLPWVGIVAITSSAILISIVLAVFIGVFAAATAGRIPFPMYQVARLIYVGRFVQRLESLFVFVWTGAAVLKMGFALWTASYLYAWLFRMPVVRPVVAPLAALVFVLSFIPRDFTTLLYLSGSVVERYGGIITIALPTGLVCVAAIVSRARQRRSAA